MQSTQQETTTIETAQKLGLTSDEFEQISEVLGRTPNFTELRIYSVMWSEYHSHKNSIKWLKTLPREGRHLLDNGEENTRLINLGGGHACVFNIKSHHLPSSMEEGTKPSLDGVHQDIFAIGARPIAAFSSLRFGNPSLEENRKLIKEVVKGITEGESDFDVPMVGGEVFFDDVFNQNSLVNTMSVGVVKVDETITGRALEAGNLVFIMGDATTKGGSEEAPLSSVDTTAKLGEGEPVPQVVKTNRGKSLLEACIEASKTGVVLGMQHMEEAGLICAAAKMSAKAGTGMAIQLDKIPTERVDQKDWEILCSKNQEQVMMVTKAGEEETLFRVCEKWGLTCWQIGEVTDTGSLQYFHHGEMLAEVPADSLVLGNGAPIYDRKVEKPEYIKKVRGFNLNRVKTPTDYLAAAKKLFSSLNLLSKRWVYEQYSGRADANNSETNAPSDAVILGLENSGESLVATVACNSNYVYADPYIGAVIAVSKAARSITCSGGMPLAVSNCLNFGDPYDPSVYYQFTNAVKGIGDACRRFATPVTGSQVSFYNQVIKEEEAEPVFPTPTIGMLGVLEKPEHRTTLDFKNLGDLIYMVGNSYNDLGSSEYLRVVEEVEFSKVPKFDLHEEFEIQEHVRNLIRKNLVSSAHDVSEGGLFTNLMECAILSNLGFNIETVETFRKDCFLFGESQSRVVISIAPEHEDELLNYLINNNVSFIKLGEVIENDAVIDNENFGSINSWKRIYDDTLGEIMEQ